MSRTPEQLVRALMQILYGYTEPFKIWGPWLFQRDPYPIPESLQNTVFPLFYGCLRDVAEAETKYLPRISIEAEDTTIKNFSLNVYQIANRCRIAGKCLEIMSTEEQVILTILRDRFSHGYLDGATRDSRQIKILRNGVVSSVCFDRSELVSILGGSKQNFSLGKISPLRSKFERRWRHVEADVAELFVDREQLADALLAGQIVVFNNQSR